MPLFTLSRSEARTDHPRERRKGRESVESEANPSPVRASLRLFQVVWFWLVSCLPLLCLYSAFFLFFLLSPPAAYAGLLARGQTTRTISRSFPLSLPPPFILHSIPCFSVEWCARQWRRRSVSVFLFFFNLLRFFLF